MIDRLLARLTSAVPRLGVSSPAGTNLSSLDVAFLCLEQPGTPMHVGGLATFAPEVPVDAQRIAALLRTRAIRIPRLGQRVQHQLLPFGSAQWVTDPTFELDWHVRSHQLPWPGDFTQLESYVSLAMSEPLDMRRPLWQAHVITGCADGGFAVLLKLHHALADGATAMLLGLELLDQGDRPAAVDPGQAASGTLSGSGLSVADRILSTGLAAINALPGIVEQAKETAGIASEVLRNARWGAARSYIPAATGLSRRLVTRTLPLADVRQVRTHHGGTVNDVLLAVLAGAFREWLQSSGRPVHGGSLRALVPVSRRSRVRGAVAGNNYPATCAICRSGFLIPNSGCGACGCRWTKTRRRVRCGDQVRYPCSRTGSRPCSTGWRRRGRASARPCCSTPSSRRCRYRRCRSRSPGQACRRSSRWCRWPRGTPSTSRC